MKPRTKLEKLVTELSEKLPDITKEQVNWAKEHLFGHLAYKCKDELWCSECGKMWVNTSKDKLGEKNRMSPLSSSAGRKSQSKAEDP